MLGSAIASTNLAALSASSANSGPIWRAMRPLRTRATALRMRTMREPGRPASSPQHGASSRPSVAIERDELVEVAGRARAPLECPPARQLQPPQLSAARIRTGGKRSPAGVASSHVMRPRLSPSRQASTSFVESRAAPLCGHQHHADPGVAGGVRQQRSARDDLASGRGRHARSLAQEQGPIGLVLVPIAWVDSRCPSIARPTPSSGRRRVGVSIGHRATRIWSACRGSASPQTQSAIQLDQLLYIDFGKTEQLFRLAVFISHAVGSSLPVISTGCRNGRRTSRPASAPPGFPGR